MATSTLEAMRLKYPDKLSRALRGLSFVSKVGNVGAALAIATNAAVRIVIERMFVSLSFLWVTDSTLHKKNSRQDGLLI